MAAAPEAAACKSRGARRRQSARPSLPALDDAVEAGEVDARESLEDAAADRDDPRCCPYPGAQRAASNQLGVQVTAVRKSDERGRLVDKHDRAEALTRDVAASSSELECRSLLR